ncbi:HEPN domain protein [Methanobrevibacter cuticularis]|uniref:HEPN domain protein n=1 Tax=Methanobrevibacter cuticularis TaxID=47311 RepID=A0A166CJE6_9EURY|nr:HEPN domain-containing protein [Methanobrevibacter cuticularis]KZX14575.1 HEPN domain protein [Methanobrevibacter cuticularis]
MDDYNLIFKKSIETLESAESNFQNGYYDTSINRSYYAVFYSANALLVKKGIKAKTHKGIGRKFGLEFIINDKFDKGIGKLLSKLHEERLKVDYDFYFESSEEKAKKDLNRAKKFIEECKKFL